jgi:DNA polymerase III delta prime subunit
MENFNAFNAMSGDLRNKLGGYYLSLQSSYGDPRVYQMQQEQMQKDMASVAYQRSKNTERLLADAYARQTERVRETHAERISKRATQAQKQALQKTPAAASASSKAK